MIEPLEPSEDKWGPVRARLVAGALGLLFVVIVGRSAQVALSGEPGNLAHAGAPAAAPRRADIVDRKGQLLATTVPAWSLSADPGAIWDAKEVAAGIAGVLPGTNVDDLARKLADKDKKFIAIQRGLTPRQRDAIFKLGLEGLRFQEEQVRLYPGGHLAGHLLGYINGQGKGKDGIERAFEDRLTGGGEPLKLTIDAGVQFALEAELDKAAEDFTMKGAAGVVIDASTGAVRAIASWPAVDPNHPGEGDDDIRLDRALGADYELGSIFKPLTVAAAIEAGELKINDTFDVTTPIRIGGATIHDSHTLDHAKAVTVSDILAYSSNIGAVQIAQRLGVTRLKAFLAQDGLLGRTSFDGPASAYPIVPAEWDPLTSATIAFGQGIAVSPLAFAAAFAPFANGGDYLDPFILEPAEPAAGKGAK